MKNKKIILVIVIMLLGSIFLSGCSSLTEKESSYNKNNLEKHKEKNSAEETETKQNDIKEENKKETQTTTSTSTSTITIGQKNALSSAKSYISFMAFSYTGLIKQLEYEGYTKEEAKYGVDNCGADWNEQAAKMAEDYLKIMSFSRKELIKQLEYEGFTSSQAEYGVSAIGY